MDESIVELCANGRTLCAVILGESSGYGVWFSMQFGGGKRWQRRVHAPSNTYANVYARNARAVAHRRHSHTSRHVNRGPQGVSAAWHWCNGSARDGRMRIGDDLKNCLMRGLCGRNKCTLRPRPASRAQSVAEWKRDSERVLALFLDVNERKQTAHTVWGGMDV